MRNPETADGDVDPLRLVDNARLALHHHMAAAEPEPETSPDERNNETADGEVDPLRLVDNARLALHHHMAAAEPEPETSTRQ